MNRADKAVERYLETARRAWLRLIGQVDDSHSESGSVVMVPNMKMDRLFALDIDDAEKSYDFSAPSMTSDGAIKDLIYTLSGTRPFKRLLDIRFLGALDYLLVKSPNGSPKNQRYSRAQHSLGVAVLAAHYSNLVLDSEYDRKLCVAAALLHDIGHSPFSHTLEPVLERHFGMNHHLASENIILGKSAPDIPNALALFGLDPLDVVDLLRTKADRFDGYFSGPINFDTIEGILRARSYLKMDHTGLSPVRVLMSSMSRKTARDKDSVDAFWVCKDEMYNLVIRSKTGVLFDALFQQVAEYCISEFDESDFMLTETQSFKKHPSLREVLNPRYWPAIIDRVMPDSLPFETRRFMINEEVDFFSGQYADRYTQSKAPNALTLK